MKRGQIRRHQLTWLVLTPLLLGVFVAALLVRPDPAALVTDLPAALEE